MSNYNAPFYLLYFYEQQIEIQTILKSAFMLSKKVVTTKFFLANSTWWLP